MSNSNMVIYVDGSCIGNPGPGGWAAIGFRDETMFFSYSGGEKNTTNNRMEIMAAIRALMCVPVGEAATVITDSQYVCKGITEWIVNWRKNLSERLNGDLWARLDALNQERTIDWRWVRGHAGNHGNELADNLAHDSAMAIAKGMPDSPLPDMPDTTQVVLPLR